MEQWSKAELGILVHMWSCLLSPLCLPGQVLSLVFPVSWHPEPHIVYSSLSLLSESGCSLLRMVTRSLGGRQRCCILLQPFALSGDLSTSSRRVKAEHCQWCLSRAEQRLELCELAVPQCIPWLPGDGSLLPTPIQVPSVSWHRG